MITTEAKSDSIHRTYRAFTDRWEVRASTYREIGSALYRSPEVSWPSIGSVDPEEALDFAAAMTCVAVWAEQETRELRKAGMLLDTESSRK